MQDPASVLPRILLSRTRVHRTSVRSTAPSPHRGDTKCVTCRGRRSATMEGAHHVRGLRKGPLLAAVALPVLFAVFGTILVGGSGLEWYEQLKMPWFVVPLGIFYLVGALYYVLFAIVLYRVLSRVGDARGRAISLGLALGVMLFNELWNYAFFGLRSTLAGFLGIVVFLVLLTALVAALLRYERFSAVLVVPYYLWVLLYDLAWTYELWRLN